MTMVTIKRLSLIADNWREGGGVAGMEIIDAHCAHLVRLNRSDGTIYQRLRTLRRLETFLAPATLLDVTIDQLREHTNRGLGAEAHYAEVSHITQFYRWAVIEGHLDRDPSLLLERPTRPDGLPRPMPRALVRRALHEAPEPERTWYRLAVRAGLRACEIAPVRTRDLHDGLLVIPEEKGGGMGAVPIPSTLVTDLAPYLAARSWWFPHSLDPARHITAARLSQRANRWLREAGIPHTLHSLRHTYGTNMYRLSGYDLLLTADLMRHRRLDTTRRYAKLDPNRARNVVELQGEDDLGDAA